MSSDFDLEAELGLLNEVSVETVEDRDELGQRIMQSAMSKEGGSFAVKSRSASQATGLCDSDAGARC